MKYLYIRLEIIVVFEYPPEIKKFFFLFNEFIYIYFIDFLLSVLILLVLKKMTRMKGKIFQFYYFLNYIGNLSKL